VTEISIETPWRRDPEQLGERFEAWFAHVLPEGAAPAVVQVTTPEGNGYSSETLLVDVEHSADPSARGGSGSPTGFGVERFAIRMTPAADAYPVFPEYDLGLQHRCLEVVREHTDVPVPDAPWFESDPSWMGSPFLVMRRVDGVAPADIPPYSMAGWIHDATPEQRAELQRVSVGVLAGLHTLDPARHPLGFLDRPQYGEAALDQQLAYQREYFEWAREGVEYPVVERLFEWLHANRPAEDGPTTITWGDSRIGNILYRDFRPVAVLDWEMAALGPAEVDVAWMIWMHRFFEDLCSNYGLPGLPDFLSRDGVIDTYQDLSGTKLHDMEWFEVLAATRMAVITIRTSMRTIVFGQAEQPGDPDDIIGFRHLLERMLAGTYFD
jgi:aminoglycoside phosphotransferase (APT) family kinase protein